MSKKRKKKSPLRNDFTDALNVEMAERKIIERTQPKKSEVEISVDTVPEVETTAEKILAENISTDTNLVETVSVEEIPAVETTEEKVLVEKVSLEKVTVKENSALPIVEVEVDKKLEARILKEADSTFLDEKPKTDAPRKSIFRSKGMQRWEDEQREEKSPPPKVEPAPKVETPRKLSRPEKFGVVVSVAMLIYAFVNFDKPLFFLAMALFANFLRQPIGAMFGKHSDAVSNAMHTFSIVVFFGAVLFLFTD